MGNKVLIGLSVGGVLALALLAGRAPRPAPAAHPALVPVTGAPELIAEYPDGRRELWRAGQRIPLRPFEVRR